MTELVETIKRSCFYVIFMESHKPTFFTWLLVGVVVMSAILGMAAYL